jgi:hypothetical protein
MTGDDTMDNAVQLLPAYGPSFLKRPQQVFRQMECSYANVTYCLLQEGLALFPIILLI